MDDGYLIHPSKEYLKYCLVEIRKLCESLGIELNDKKTSIVKLSHGFTWLKVRFYIDENGRVIKKIYKKSVTRMRRKLKKLRKHVDDGKMTYMDAYCAYQSWRAYAMNFDAYNTIKSMDKLYNDLFIYRRDEEDVL